MVPRADGFPPGAAVPDCGDGGELFRETPAADVALRLWAGVHSNDRDEDGRTPLHREAAFNQDTTVIDALLADGADPNDRDKDGETPLYRAACFNKNSAVIEALLAAGADPNA